MIFESAYYRKIKSQFVCSYCGELRTVCYCDEALKTEPSVSAVEFIEQNFAGKIAKGECIVTHVHGGYPGGNVVKIEAIEKIGFAGWPYTVTLENGYEEHCFGNYRFIVEWAAQ